MQTMIHRDSRAWQLPVWASFGIAVFLCGVGLAYLTTRTFTLAKTLRDRREADLAEAAVR